MRQTNRRILHVLLSLSMVFAMLVPLQMVQAVDSDPSTAQLLDTRSMEIAPNATYNWYSMKMPRGLEKVHSVEFSPSRTRTTPSSLWTMTVRRVMCLTRT